MKRLLTLTALIFLILRPTQGQSTHDELIGEYFSIENQFKSFSTMILKNDHRFKYLYQTGECRGNLEGTWKNTGRKLVFENDSSFLNKTTQYPNLGLSTWTITSRGIQPDQIVDSGCLRAHRLHSKRDTVTSLYTSISLVGLIANPEKYHCKKIKITGYMNLEFEGDAIYLHKEDYENPITTNAFWISFSEKLDERMIKKLNGKYVLIDGTFDMNSHGHMGLFGGEIKDITRIDKWGN